jgi:hypothetical protein
MANLLVALRSMRSHDGSVGRPLLILLIAA